MTDRPYRGSIDYDRLSSYFRALSIPTRVELLQKLQVPLAPSEIHLQPVRRDRTHRSDRPLARQTVEGHLAVLEEAGLVRSRAALREGRPVREYIVNQPRLFTMADEVRRLSLIRPLRAGATRGSAGPLTAEPEAGPGRASASLPPTHALVLVSGPLEGRAFALQGAGPWSVGRARDAHVCLDYDPFVSAANCEVEHTAAGFLVHDLPGSKNGTALNWRLLEADEAAPMAPGDTLAVGRSLLIFRGPADGSPARPTRR